MTVYTEREYKVGTEGVLEYLTIRPAPDFPDSGVLLYAKGKADKEYFGEVYLQLDADFMRALGRALIACADDVQAVRTAG